MIEVNLRICKMCGELKQRIQDGKYNIKDKRWMDETGKLWNGSICPICNKLRTKQLMREKRNDKPTQKD